MVKFLKKNDFFKKIVSRVIVTRARRLVQNIQDFLRESDDILDIGAGTCSICHILSKRGHKIIPLDVQNLSFVDSITPVIYDGNRIPFEDNRFDVSLILTVLHHTKKPEAILMEAKRVSKKIIVMEDIYTNWFHKYITYFFDSLLNLEFFDHPHANKDDAKWKEIFKKFRLNLIDVKYYSSFLFFRHAIYFLEK